MNIRKHIRLIGLIGVIGFFSACNNGEAVYITEPTEILLLTLPDKLTASSADVTVTPVDDRAYFYIECAPVDKYEPGTMDRDFMMLVMDSVYIDYLTWRYYRLIEGEEYVAPFSSHNLKYGVQDVHFSNLEPNTEYMVFAFCVNPINNQPMGDLYTHYFITDSLSNADLSFQFKLEQKILYVMPSDDDTQYVYFFDFKQTVVDEYKNDPLEYMSDWVLKDKANGLFEFDLRKNAYMIDLSYFPEGDVLFMCTAYDGVLSSNYAVAEVIIDAEGNCTLVEDNEYKK